MTYKLSDDFLAAFFGEGNPAYQYATAPYSSLAEYERDKSLIEQLHSSANPQDKTLLAIAAKVERSDAAMLGLKSPGG